MSGAKKRELLNMIERKSGKIFDKNSCSPSLSPETTANSYVFCNFLKMNKISWLLITLFIGFGIGYFTRGREENNKGWQKFDSSKWIPYEQGVHGKNYRKKMVFDFARATRVSRWSK